MGSLCAVPPGEPRLLSARTHEKASIFCFESCFFGNCWRKRSNLVASNRILSSKGPNLYVRLQSTPLSPMARLRSSNNILMTCRSDSVANGAAISFPGFPPLFGGRQLLLRSHPCRQVQLLPSAPCRRSGSRLAKRARTRPACLGSADPKLQIAF